MKLLIYISLLLTITLNAQTDLVLDSSVRLQANQIIKVNSIKGNGFTIYMKCGSVLLVKNGMINVKIKRDILVDENCDTEPTVIYEVPSKNHRVLIDGCINVKKIIKIIKLKPLTFGR